MNGIESISLESKYCLTIAEASAYFGIGEKKLRQIISDNTEAEYLLHNGAKNLIKRKAFEKFIDGAFSI